MRLIQVKETFAIGAAFFVASVAPTFAQDYYEGSTHSQSVENSCDCESNCCESNCCESTCCSECCPPKDPCAKCAQLWPSCGPDWIITPGAGPCTADGCDVFITAEFIYWAVRQDHMGFAFSSPTDSTVTTLGEFFHPKWRMEPGFKVGLGWLTCIDGWDLYLNYTWLRPRTNTRTVKPKTGFELFDANYTFGNAFTEFESETTITQETARWELDFDVLDLEWGRNFYVSQCLYLRPYFGLKGTWQNQRLKTSATAQEREGSTTTFDTILATGNHKIDYWGIGPRAGLDSAWHFNKCFSVIGEVSATALWGRFNNSSLATRTDTVQDITTVIPQTNLKTEWHSMKPVMEFLLGFRWEDWWCCDEYYISLDLGWEVQWWGGQNQFVFSHTETRWGDLGMQGLTIKARFQF